ncbi:hypothetical protein [Zhihengliuella halotolerans]|uniref:Uncharacterized protein n=1 Tax=Zhihengliuella halotolerans TaxID=370736 RepID=A0A4V6MGG6_9MICC|nr:hypothetical protein [Zhihengliuella halotolerans]RZU63046.1 hypothetical protein EV380_2653 [Zhihengliuella halotolerans]
MTPVSSGVLRWRPAFITFAVAAALGIFALSQYGEPAASSADAVTGLSIRGLVLVAPVVSVAAAWQAAALFDAGWTHRVWQRGWFRIAWGRLWRLLVAAAAAWAVQYIVVASSFNLWFLPSPLVLVTYLATVAAAATTGFAVGWRLRAVIALPVLAAGWFFVLAFAPAVEPLWLRHLALLEDCCSADQVPNPRVVAAIVLMALFCVVVSWLGAAGMRRTWVRWTAAGVALLLPVTAVGLVQHLDWRSTAARTGDLVCVGEDPKVCVWPENAASATAEWRKAAPVLADISRRTGAHVPVVLTQSSDPDQVAGERAFGTLIQGTDNASVGAAASARLDDDCLERLDEVDEFEVDAAMSDVEEMLERNAALFEAHDLLVAWWVDQAGGAVETTADEPDAALASLKELDATAQGMWADRAARAVSACSAEDAADLLVRLPRASS